MQNANNQLSAELRVARAQRDQLAGHAPDPASSATHVLDAREQAVLAAHRLHAAACRATGLDEHWAGRALASAGWRDPDSRRTLLRGAVARHHGLATVTANSFGQMDGASPWQL